MHENIFTLLEAALRETDAANKADLTQTIWAKQLSGSLNLDVLPREHDIQIAGRPTRPQLVSHEAVQARKLSSKEGYAAMLHAICHIEFNAINLALDAAWRFRSMPQQFTLDWLKVAQEEAQHFLLMRACLQQYSYDYGDFPAHGNLWDMAYKTAFDPLLRMALVPRVLEARGLDVTPAIRAKVAQKGDEQTCAALDVIYRDEVGHVKIGNFWYQYLCEQRGLEPIALFRQLIQRFDMFIFRGYVNKEARERAGFSAFELELLEHFEQSMRAQ
ncbi:ferritin-like domain-containing protein [Neisseriaceae bacterium B1]